MNTSMDADDLLDSMRGLVIVVLRVALNGSITRSLDLEMAGAPRETVRAMLCEELRVDNVNYTSRWLLIGLEETDGPTVFVARPADLHIADVFASALSDGAWTPWDGVASEAALPLDVRSFPDRVRSLLTAQGWRRSIVAPVHVHDRLVAAFILVGQVPENYDALNVKQVVAARIQTLVRAAALLIERWGDQDHLQIAASTDELTGLFNRRQLFARLEDERREGSLLYIDVDDFKYVNDRFGHAVGDEFVVVLPGADAKLADQIARRIIDRVAEPLAIDPGPLDVSVSIGHARLDSHDPLEAADHAMLRAKRSGRRLVTASDPD